MFFLSIKIGFAGQETEAKGENILVHTHQSLGLTLEPYTFHRSEQLFAPLASVFVAIILSGIIQNINVRTIYNI